MLQSQPYGGERVQEIINKLNQGREGNQALNKDCQYSDSYIFKRKTNIIQNDELDNQRRE